MCVGLCMCHGECSANSFKDGFSVKSLRYVMRKLINFLMKNENEIITVFLEDYVRSTTLLTGVLSKIKHFNKLLFNPYATKWSVNKKGWPKITDMIQANKRLLIVDDEQRALHAGSKSGIIRRRDFLIENHYEWIVNKTKNSTKFNENDAENSTKLFHDKNVS